MKLLHTADLHIGAELSYLGERAESRKYEVLEVFKNICNICRTENVEICLIAGDLFDSNAAAKSFIQPVLNAVAEAESTRFFYVAGNHDPLNTSSPFTTEKLPENLTVLGGSYETAVLEDMGVRITGRSFTHSAMEFCEMPPMPQDGLINILLMHSDFGATGSIYNPLPLGFAESCGADYLALGHIHKRTAVEKLGNTYIAYCGCPEGQGFDESGIKGVYCGDLTKKGCELRFIECSKRVHIVKKIDLSGVESTAEAEKLICERLADELGENYVKQLFKLVLTGSVTNPSAINTAELTAALKAKLYFVKIKNRLKQQIDLELLSNEISLKGIFVKKLLERIKNADKDEQKLLIDALYLGLEAFNSEVAYDED